MQNPRSSEENSDIPDRMRAAMIDRYGLPASIKVDSIKRPNCGDDEVLVEIRAASVNPYDWHTMSGTPWLMRLGNGLIRPKSRLLGIDCAGVVTAVGTNAKRFSVGDEVFGFGIGTFAEYACAKEKSLTLKPAGVSFKEAGAVGVAALTALQGLRNHGHIKQGNTCWSTVHPVASEPTQFS